MSDYIREMRRFVGHRPLLQAGASVLLEDARGRLLLQRRADCHLWGYHGGILVGNEAVNGNFQPNLGCSRAYVVTYLYDLFVLTAP